MKYQYSDATTRRYKQWIADRIKSGECQPPRLAEIESWLRDSEDYRDSLGALANLCVGLRESNEAGLVQWIASALISSLENERSFSSKAEAFFSAAISRVGVEDFDVRMYDKKQRPAGTLHDLQLQERVTDAVS